MFLKYLISDVVSVNYGDRWESAGSSVGNCVRAGRYGSVCLMGEIGNFDRCCLGGTPGLQLLKLFLQEGRLGAGEPVQ